MTFYGALTSYRWTQIIKYYYSSDITTTCKYDCIRKYAWICNIVFLNFITCDVSYHIRVMVQNISVHCAINELPITSSQKPKPTNRCLQGQHKRHVSDISLIISVLFLANQRAFSYLSHFRRSKPEQNRFTSLCYYPAEKKTRHKCDYKHSWLLMKEMQGMKMILAINCKNMTTCFYINFYNASIQQFITSQYLT